jgi:hypothetical protein
MPAAASAHRRGARTAGLLPKSGVIVSSEGAMKTKAHQMRTVRNVIRRYPQAKHWHRFQQCRWCGRWTVARVCNWCYYAGGQ